jgi:hypothetical protein
MLRIITRLAVFIVIGVAAFYAMKYYAVFRFGQHLGECSIPAELDIVGSTKARDSEKYAISSRVYSCINKKRSFVDSIFLKISGTWTKPTPATFWAF